MAKRACGTWHKTKSGKDAPCITEDGRPCSLHPAGAHETDSNGNTIVAYSESEFLEKKNAGTIFGFSHVSKEEKERKAKEQAAFEAYTKAYDDNMKSLEMGYNSVKNNTDDEIPDFKDYKWSSFPHTGPDGKVLSLTSEEYARYLAEGVYQREIGNGIQAHEIYEDPNYDFEHHQHGPEWIQKQIAETEYKKEYRSIMSGHSENEKTTITAKDGHEIQISKLEQAQASAEVAYQHEMGNTNVTFEDIALHPNYDYKNHKPGDTENLHKPYEPAKEVGSESPAAGVYNSRFKDVNSVNVDSMAAQGVISDKEAADFREYTVHKGNIRDVMAMSNSENGYGNASNLAAAWQRRNDKDISGVEQQELEKSVLYSLSKKSYVPEVRNGDDAAAKVAQATRDRILKEAEKKYPEKVALIRRNDELEKRKQEAAAKSSDYELNPPAPPSQSEIEKRKQQREQKKRVDSVLEALRKRNAELAHAPRQTRADRTPTSEFPIVGKTPRPKTDYEKLEDKAKAVGFKNFGMLSRLFGTKAATKTLEQIEAKKAEQARNARKVYSTNTPPPAPPQSRFRPNRPVPPAPPAQRTRPVSPLAPRRPERRSTMASEVMRGVRESGPSEQEMIRNARRYDNMSSYDASDDTRLYSSRPSPVPPPPAPSRGYNFEAFSLSRDMRNGVVRRRLREDSPYHEDRYSPRINRQFEDMMIESRSARETYYNRYSSLSSSLNRRVPSWLRPSLKDVVYARGYQSPSWNMKRIAEVEAGSPYVARHYTTGDNIRDTAIIMKSRIKIGLATALSALFNAGKEARMRRESIY